MMSREDSERLYYLERAQKLEAELREAQGRCNSLRAENERLRKRHDHDESSIELWRNCAVERGAKIEAALVESERRGPDVEGWDVVFRMVKALKGDSR